MTNCHLRRCLLIACSSIFFALPAVADIYKWEYVDPNNPSLGKQESAILTPGGSGVSAAPHANLSDRDLSQAYLFEADLSRANLYRSNLTQAFLAGANLTSADAGVSNFTSADFSGANLLAARFDFADLSNATFAGADLWATDLSSATITSADFSGARLRYTKLPNMLTAAQLYSTASYQARSLIGVEFTANLTGWDFSNQDLTDAGFRGSILTGTNFSNTIIRQGDLAYTTSFGFTPATLYSTASYAAKDLSGVDLSYNNLSGWDFAGQNLTDADFHDSDLSSANFFQADLTKVSFSDYTILSNTDFRSSNLTNAIFGTSDLRSVKLTNANLSGARLDVADITGVDLAGTIIKNSHFRDNISQSQIYSSASYQSGDISGISLLFASFPGIDFSNKNLSTADLSYSDFSGASFSDANLTRSRLSSSDFTGANFEGANLSNSDLSSRWQNANFDRAILTGARFYSAPLHGATFHGAIVAGAQFSGSSDPSSLTSAQLYSTASYQNKDLTGISIHADMTGWDFTGQNLTNASLSGSKLTNAIWNGAVLHGAIIAGSTLPDANFTSAKLRDTRFSTSNLQNAQFTGMSLIRSEFQGADLTNAHFANADLTGSNLYRANASGADFSGSNLRDASFRGTLLTDANLTNADIRGAAVSGFTLQQLYSTASYQNRNLRGVSLTGSMLPNADFQSQDLTNAFFDRATLTAATFANADLTNAWFVDAQIKDVDFSDAIVTGAKFNSTADDSLTLGQLYSTASYKQRRLGAIGLSELDLTGADFSQHDLRGADFKGATLSAADFSQSRVEGADFTAMVSRGFTSEQLYSTRSYKEHSLRNIKLSGNDLAGWNFRDQDLTGAAIIGNTPTGTDFTRADLRGANDYPIIWFPDQFLGSIQVNTIRIDGSIHGFNLAAGETMRIRDDDPHATNYGQTGALPIRIKETFNMDPASALQFAFEADNWDSTISFDPGITVSRSGELRLDFASDVFMPNQIGRTFELFNWPGVVPTGTFDVVSPYVWDLTNLYVDGRVTLLDVPFLPGDFNQDGLVDAADYVVLRVGLGTNYSQSDYDKWRAHYGATANDSQFDTAPVPEPSIIVMLSIVLLAVTFRSRRHGTALSAFGSPSHQSAMSVLRNARGVVPNDLRKATPKRVAFEKPQASAISVMESSRRPRSWRPRSRRTRRISSAGERPR
jgi:uncharacterized protein YjbI with pentapeptide repeats